MKKFLISLTIILTFFGCEDNIESNTPAFQGSKNANFIWKSTNSTVVVDSTRVLTIKGTDGFGMMTLKVPSLALGTFVLGVDAAALAIYSEDDFIYSTVHSGNDSVVHVSDGAIMIDEIDMINATISGTFYFNAYSADGERVINFSKGVIYKLPLTMGTL